MKIIAITLLFFLIGLPKFVLADTTTVINNISASANTGGNTAGSGEVIQGKSEASVKVYTEVNGEAVEDFEKTVESVSSGDVEVEYKTADKNNTEVAIEIEKQELETNFFIKIFNYVLSFFKF